MGPKHRLTISRLRTTSDLMPKQRPAVENSVVELESS